MQLVDVACEMEAYRQKSQWNNRVAFSAVVACVHVGGRVGRVSWSRIVDGGDNLAPKGSLREAESRSRSFVPCGHGNRRSNVVTAPHSLVQTASCLYKHRSSYGDKNI